MEIVTKITNKIKALGEKRDTQHIALVLIVVFAMIISYIFGKLSIETGDRGPSEKLTIYLPNGSLYTADEQISGQNPLTAYILGGATDAYRAPHGPSVQERVAQVENMPEYTSIAESSSIGGIVPLNGQNEGIFGSKNGSTYYVVGCKSGNRVKPENRIYFESETDAEDQGYSRSKLCK